MGILVWILIAIYFILVLKSIFSSKNCKSNSNYYYDNYFDFYDNGCNSDDLDSNDDDCDSDDFDYD